MEGYPVRSQIGYIEQPSAGYRRARPLVCGAGSEQQNPTQGRRCVQVLATTIWDPSVHCFSKCGVDLGSFWNVLVHFGLLWAFVGHL